MPLSWRGATRTMGGPQALGGNLRPIPQLPDGIVWGGPGRCWRATSRGGYATRSQFRGHPRPDTAHWQAYRRYPGLNCPRSTCSLPAAEQVCGTAPVTKLALKPWETCVLWTCGYRYTPNPPLQGEGDRAAQRRGGGVFTSQRRVNLERGYPSTTGFAGGPPPPAGEDPFAPPPAFAGVAMTKEEYPPSFRT